MLRVFFGIAVLQVVWFSSFGEVLAQVHPVKDVPERVAIEEVPKKESAERPKGSLELYSEALQLKKEGDLQAARDLLLEAVKKSPRFVKAHVNLARVYLGLGEVDLALDAAKRAVELDPGSFSAHNLLGLSYSEKGMQDEAMEEYKKAIEINPDYPWTYNNLALLHIRSGNFEEAVSLLLEALKLRRDVSYFFNNLGIAYENLNRLEDARIQYEEALKVDQNYEKARLNLQRVTSLLKKKGIAKPKAEEAKTGISD